MAKTTQITPTRCPLCDFESKRITTVNQHIEIVHNMTPKKAYDKIFGEGRCGCDCGQTTVFQNVKHGYPKFLKGHNANIYAIYGEKKAKEISEKRAAKLRNRPTWSKGLTKKTDERVRKRAEAISKAMKQCFHDERLVIWNKGKSKETDERILKRSIEQKQAFEDGKLQSWHKGLTEEMDERLAAKNENLRQRYKNGELIPWHKGLTASEDDRLDKAWKSRDPQKEYAHVRWSEEQIREQLQLNSQIKLEHIDNYKNDRKPALWMRCSACGWFEKTTLVFARNDRCPKCAPEGSKLQHDIADWIESFSKLKVGRNIKGLIGRRELDIYVPARGIAIEINGLYWHNELSGKDAKYHQEKTAACNLLGIGLMHIFEDEWYQKNDIIKSMIANRLNLNIEKIHARKCKVVELTKQERQNFFNTNHIEGDTVAIKAFGLTFNDELVSAISLRKPFHKTHKDKVEIARSCSKLNINVVGGVSRLIKKIVAWAQTDDYKKIITYADTRLGTGKSYELAGFQLVNTTAPRFWWTDSHKRYNRFRFKADNSREMTEAQVAEEAGVVKIWGCSNNVYELQI